MTDPSQADARTLDGNAAAGPLTDLFAVDVTVLSVTCAGCGGSAALATYVLYADAPALVLRCPSCSSVVLRYGRVGGGVRLDLAGASAMGVPGSA